MRFLIDENVGPSVARWLVASGHDVDSVYESGRGMDDATILAKSHGERRILITGDKDFGDMVHRQRLPHHGIVLLRLEDDRSLAKIEVLRRLLNGHADSLESRFVVVTEKQIRIAADKARSGKDG